MGRISSRTGITAEERLMLVGLFALARDHNRAMKDIERAAFAITRELDSEGKPADYGHTSDALYSDYHVDDLLSRLELTVEPQSPSPDTGPQHP